MPSDVKHNHGVARHLLGINVANNRGHAFKLEFWRPEEERQRHAIVRARIAIKKHTAGLATPYPFR